MEYPITIAMDLDITDAYVPGNDGFDENETPILEWHEKDTLSGQPGWNLFYKRAEDNKVDNSWIGGEFGDLEWALKQAQNHLNLIEYPWPRK